MPGLFAWSAKTCSDNVQAALGGRWGGGEAQVASPSPNPYLLALSRLVDLYIVSYVLESPLYF